NKGLILYQEQRFEEALECHDQVVEINPNWEIGWTNRGDTLFQLRRLEDAINS
ncbi:MAG: tetratricopeptide repeat protein, partial [Thermoplasmata archaeon]|nr:tetratricopeptide repeat protein [Thermoplasmata archaeon]NIS14109.1 tetratricopeptide repeat protein [Thermoplasmata archaeon]NIS21956.1 tetratricopeptide repeat protein [Thermoplasmata archaeon]NIT79815.1 tetratricopeptide repeat protein [Thermoplasmata archaeon]NIU50981.1 tetratricopeptide repeat protein [Thermoplasmata archaeon]